VRKKLAENEWMEFDPIRWNLELKKLWKIFNKIAGNEVNFFPKE
jgi:hypothetical protein